MWIKNIDKISLSQSKRQIIPFIPDGAKPSLRAISAHAVARPSRPFGGCARARVGFAHGLHLEGRALAVLAVLRAAAHETPRPAYEKKDKWVKREKRFGEASRRKE